MKERPARVTGPRERDFLRIKERTRKLMSERVYKFEKLNSI